MSMLRFFIVYTTILFFSILTVNVSAQTATSSSTIQDEFSVSSDILLNFDVNTNAKVHTVVTLTNLTTENYPSVLLYEIPKDASELSVSDESGNLPFSIQEEQGKKSISITMPPKSVGMNAKTVITFLYSTKQYYKTTDKGWQLFVPKFDSKQQQLGYVISVTYPDAWGTPQSVYPKNGSLRWSFNQNEIQPIQITFYKDTVLYKTVYPNTYRTIRLGILIGVLITICILLILFKKLRK
jgi:hypothetical protein